MGPAEVDLPGRSRKWRAFNRHGAKSAVAWWRFLRREPM
jgi:hypothetical protein